MTLVKFILCSHSIIRNKETVMKVSALSKNFNDVQNKLYADSQARKKSGNMHSARLIDFQHEHSGAGIKYVFELLMNFISGGIYFSHKNNEKMKESLADFGIVYEGLKMLRKNGDIEGGLVLYGGDTSYVTLGQRMQGGQLMVYVSENTGAGGRDKEFCVTADALMSVIEDLVQENIEQFFDGLDTRNQAAQRLVFAVVRKMFLSNDVTESNKNFLARQLQRNHGTWGVFKEEIRDNPKFYFQRQDIEINLPNYLSGLHKLDKRLQKMVFDGLNRMAIYKLKTAEKYLQQLRMDVKSNLRTYLNCFASACDASLQKVIIYAVLDLLKSGNDSQRKICKDFIVRHGGASKFFMLFNSWVDILKFYRLVK